MEKHIKLFIGVVALALLLRLFVVEAFKIPTASMLPSLLIGDYIFVNKLAYGFKVPFLQKKFWHNGLPSRGDVIVFDKVDDGKKVYIKRVVGLPGDKIRVSDEDLYINDMKLAHAPIEVSADANDSGRLLVQDNPKWSTIPFVNRWKSYNFFSEQTGEVDHLVQYEKDMFRPERTFEVPAGHVFAMGDNRDNSADSREWGAVPLTDIIGRAMIIWFSVDADHGGLRWGRIGNLIQ